MKRYQSNFRYIPGLSQAANQIIKIQKSLYQAANPINTRSAFREMGIITIFNLNQLNSPEKTTFDLREVKKMRFYEESFLYQLFQSHLPMTRNQLSLLQYYQKRNQQKEKKKCQRINLAYFSSPEKKAKK